jgi:small-conductance mechanosensitive channel
MFFGPPSPEDEEADRNLSRALREGRTETLRAFAVLAVLLQAAVLAVALGAMLVWFRGQRLVGGVLVVAGLLGFGVAIAVYRRSRPQTDS